MNPQDLKTYFDPHIAHDFASALEGPSGRDILDMGHQQGPGWSGKRFAAPLTPRMHILTNPEKKRQREQNRKNLEDNYDVQLQAPLDVSFFLVYVM